jgi:hypothetical protein
MLFPGKGTEKNSKVLLERLSTCDDEAQAFQVKMQHLWNAQKSYRHFVRIMISFYFEHLMA